MDRQPAAIALAEHNVPDHHRPRLRTLAADFTTLTLPAADLIYCGWSLPHCPATRFPGTWHAIRAALRPHGHTAAHLLGHRDDCAPDPAASAFRPDALDTLLAGMDVEHLEETEQDRDSFHGPKHWHYYEIIAANPRKPGASQGLPHALPAPRTLSRATSTHQHQPPPHTSPAHRTDKKAPRSRQVAGGSEQAQNRRGVLPLRGSQGSRRGDRRNTFR